MPLHDDRTCWLVKAGPKSSLARPFVEKGVVSVGSDWPGVGDLSQLSDADIFLRLESYGRRKPADDLLQLRIFSDRMSTGDLVITPDVGSGDLLFGDVTGAYAYSGSPVVADTHHWRPVSWYGRVAVDQLEPFLAKAVQWRQGVLRRLPEQVHWLRLSGEVRDGLGRPADAFPKVSAAAPAPRRRTSTPRVAAKPKTVINPDRLCPSCGLLRAASMFPEGEEHCRDCY